MIRDSRAVLIPNRREFLMANVIFQKMSCPLEDVPKKYFIEGDRSLGTS
jgi:hypothetical protein